MRLIAPPRRLPEGILGANEKVLWSASPKPRQYALKLSRATFVIGALMMVATAANVVSHPLSNKQLLWRLAIASCVLFLPAINYFRSFRIIYVITDWRVFRISPPLTFLDGEFLLTEVETDKIRVFRRRDRGALGVEMFFADRENPEEELGRIVNQVLLESVPEPDRVEALLAELRGSTLENLA
jgi:hypothetical protein